MTTFKRVAPPLQQQLKAAGAITADVSLRESFHNQCHHGDLKLLIKCCDSHSSFQFLDVSELTLRTRSNTEGGYIKSGMLHHVVLRFMLVKQSNWHQAFATLQSSALNHDDSLIICFGPERCVPPLLARKLGPRLIQATDLNMITSRLSSNLLDPEDLLKNRRDPSDNSIAVVGMSCQLPGAADLEEF